MQRKSYKAGKFAETDPEWDGEGSPAQDRSRPGLVSRERLPDPLSEARGYRGVLMDTAGPTANWDPAAPMRLAVWEPATPVAPSNW